MTLVLMLVYVIGYSTPPTITLYPNLELCKEQATSVEKRDLRYRVVCLVAEVKQ